MVDLGRVFQTGLAWLRHSTASRFRPAGAHPSRNEPEHFKDARRNPQNYFTCTACGEGPWHNSWAAIETRTFSGKLDYYMPKRPLGGCCSGAD